MTNKQVGGLIVMFGAAGDLARRKLYPSLFRLYQAAMSLLKAKQDQGKLMPSYYHY